MRKSSKWPLNLRCMTLIGSATLMFWGSLFAFAGLLEGYAHAIHPVALLGASGVPHSTAFNVLGFVLPGVLLAATAWRWRLVMPGHSAWTVRIGAWMSLLSALAFSLQGLLPLDGADLDAVGSRLHAAVWTLWWVAFLPASLLLATGIHPDWRRSVMAGASVAVAVLAVWLALWPPEQLAQGVAQRLTLAGWFGWWLLAASGLAGRSAS